MKHVILGNGAAAITAAEKLRGLKPQDEIMVIGREDSPVYTKCMLPDYVGGKIAKEKLFIRNEDAYRKNQIELLLNRSVENIDSRNRKIFLQTGETVSYDKLLIAIGGIPFLPPVQGLDQIEYYSINSVNDADRIREKAAEGGTAVIMGAGLTGIEMAFALARLGMQVILVEREQKMLPLQMDAGASRAMAKYLEKEGITVMTGATVCQVTEEGTRCVKLEDGRTLEYDILLVAVGTRPNLSIIKDTDIKHNRGILVDEFMRSSAEDIFAAGDVAEAVNKLSNEYVTSYIWPNAIAQGKSAAYAMAGVPLEFSGSAVMQNMVQMRDMPFASMGLVNPAGEGYEIRVQEDQENGIYKKFILKDNKLKGMILVGDTKNMNAWSGMIRREDPVSYDKDLLL